MGFYLNGYILRPARVAPANAPSTSEATTGVVLDHAQPQDHGYLSNTDPISVNGLMYQASVLNKPTAYTEEYCIWAATTGMLSTPAGEGYCVAGGAIPIPEGSVQVVRGVTSTIYNDGVTSLLVQDEEGRDIQDVKTLSINAPGISGSNSRVLEEGSDFTYDATTRRLTLTTSGKTTLGGGFSVEAGDVIEASSYSLAPATFWWCKNDSVTTRFGWDGKAQRWAPFQGSSPVNLGILEPDVSFTLSPKPTRFEANGTTYLPGDPSTPDGYALLRVGLVPDSSAVPIKTLVVQDSEAAAPYSFTGILPDAIVGETNGIVQFNPNAGGILELKTGLPVWYNPETFIPTMDGDLGRLDEAATNTIVLSPIPGPTDRPFLRFGWRTHLRPIPFESDALLPDSSAVTTGTFAWSMTTGKVILSEADVNRATPGEATYELAYLGAHIYYDGVSMTQVPLPLVKPTPLENLNGDSVDGISLTVGDVGDLFVPRAQALPFPGTSGVRFVPDGTGITPNLTATPETRPNGSGLVRKVNGIGDTFVFAAGHDGGETYAFANLDVEEYEPELTNFIFRIPNTTAEVARIENTSTYVGPNKASLVQFRTRGLKSGGAFFEQAEVLPCVYSTIEEDANGDTYARIWSRNVEPFVLAGDEVLNFFIGVANVQWQASALGAGNYSAEEIADSFTAVMSAASPNSRAKAFRGRVCLEAPNQGLEIGWRADPSDLAAATATGFLPGWKTSVSAGTAFNWLPDNGMSFGFFRSPENVNAKDPTPDIRAVGVLDSVLTDNIPAVPFLNLNIFPLEDVPGYDDNVHFRVVQGLNIIDLKNYDGLYYEFKEDRVAWSGVATVPPTSILNPSTTLQLGAPLALADTVSSAAMAPLGNNFGLYLKEPSGNATVELIEGDDFVLPAEGAPGQAILTTPVAPLVLQGAAATFTQGSNRFEDGNLSTDEYLQVDKGYLLRVLNGDAAGVYTVTANYGTYLEVSPNFPVSAGPSNNEPYGQWRIYEGYTRDVYDPALIADVQQQVFDQYLEEPWKINVLSLLGPVASGNLSANAATALERGRVMKVRFTQTVGDEVLVYEESQQASVTVLQRAILIGAFTQEGMVIPDLSDSHFAASATDTTPYFAIRLGANEYSAAQGNLSLVSVFTPGLTGDVLEVGRKGSLIEGMILAGSDVEAESETAYYDQVFLKPDLIPANTCEMDPNTGDITLNATDASLFADRDAYFVEEMITKNRVDVVTAPLTGSIMFNDALIAGQIVEVDYYQADDNGDKALDDDGNPIRVVEYLPLIVRLEEAVRVDENNYTFNPTNRTYSSQVEPFVWVGANLQNYGGTVTCVVESDGEIRFAADIDAGQTVKINYGVLEAFGGEMAYTTSTTPVFNKPFFLEENQDTFVLDGDRTSDIIVGALMLVETAPFYVKSRSASTIDGVTTTTVTVWPPPPTEVGSRAPGKDATTSLSAVPVAITVDPDGDAIAADGATGFLMEFPDAIFLPVDKGALKISFYGDYREYTKPAHLIEIGGYPFVVATSTLSDDGRYTVVTLSTPSPASFSWDSDPAQSDSIRISVRPVILPGAKVFTGVSPFLGAEEQECFILGRKDAQGNEIPGSILTLDVHFTADPANGNIVFTTPTQPALKGGERLYFRNTRLDMVMPIIVDGAQYNPIYRAKNLSILTPSLDNGLLGSTLTAKFTFSNPDTFYCRVVPLVDYLPEVGAAAVAKVSSNSSSSGPLAAFPGAPINYKEGNLGLRGKVTDAKNLDQGGRAFLAFFNAIIVAWEQVLENIDGRFIGDRDGKFRLFVGHGKAYAPPGYEDIYTGELNPRNLWRLLVEEWADPALLADGYIREKDGIYGPTTYEEDTSSGATPGDVDGETKSGSEIEGWIEFQRRRIKNDIDDRVLTGLKRGAFWATLFPWLEAKGKYKYMWEPHELSRIYPELTLAFTRLFPGYGAVQDSYEGYFTAGKTIEVPGPEPGETTSSLVKTRNTTIGVVANPVFEDGIPNISDINVRNRYPRARIWAYYPEGSADLDAAMQDFDPTFSPTVGFATLVVTPLPFSEFPIDPDTGFPDVAQLISNSGTLPDAASGDFNLATPGFEANTNKLMWGHPNGVTGQMWGPSPGWGNADFWSNVYVEEIQLGCVITFNDGNGNILTGSDIYKSTGVAGFYEPLELEQGDTLWSGAPGNPVNIPEDETTALTPEDLAKITEVLDDYRVQFDLGVNRKKGVFVDKGLSKGWSNDENFPLNLQSLFGQRPPTPLSAIEADVSFVNTGEPVQIPALKGESKNDSGDVSIPYMASTNTELAVLGEAAASIELVFDSDSVLAIVTPTTAGYMTPQEYTRSQAIFPSEIPTGNILSLVADAGTDTDPNVLYTQDDMQSTASTYTLKSAEGSVRPYDLLFVETAQPLVSGGVLENRFTGIMSVADVRNSDLPIPTGSTSAIETPRFVTHTTRAQRHQYTAFNAFANNTGDAVTGPGLITTEVVAANFETYFDFSSVGGLTLDDGFAGGNGGLWNIINGFANAIRIEFYNTDPGFVGDPLVATLIIGSPSIGSPVYAINEVAGTPATLHTLQGAGLVIDSGPFGGPVGNRIVIETLNADGSVFTALGLGAFPPNTYFDFTISVDTYISPEIAAQTGLASGSGAGSTTCRILRDRLTFSERLSFADALDRDALPQNGEATRPMGLQLNVWESPVYTGGGYDPSDVNACAYTPVVGGGINGGSFATPSYLTFKTRVGPSPDGTILLGQSYVGTYSDASADGAGDEEGLIRAMSFEYNNTNTLFFNPAGDTLESLRISPAPSSNLTTASEILEYDEAVFPDANEITLVDGFASTADYWSPRTWIEEQDPAPIGATSNVEAGDIVMVGGPLSPDNGSVKAGTYIVRHSVAGNAVAPTFTQRIAEGVPVVEAGSTGWLDLRFPIIKSIDDTAYTITLRDVPGYLNHAGDMVPSTGTSGDLFIILKTQYATYDSSQPLGSRYTLVDDSVYRIPFSSGSYDAETETLTADIDPLMVVDAAGNAVSSTDFFAAATAGHQCSVSGRWPVMAKFLGSNFPENNLVGSWENANGDTAALGFSHLYAGNTSILDQNTGAPIPLGEVYYPSDAALTPDPLITGEVQYASTQKTTFTAGKETWVIAANNPADSTAFYEGRRENIYAVDDGQHTGYGSPSDYQAQGVAEYVRLITALSPGPGPTSSETSWNHIHFTNAEVQAGGAPPNVLRCFLPGDVVVAGNDIDPAGADPGYAALAGVFMEPSVPYSTITEVSSTTPRVIASSYPDSGFEKVKYGARNWGDHGGTVDYAHVSATVRRIRRFHEITTNISSTLQPLRYVYETRRGNVDQALHPPLPGDTLFTAQIDAANPWGIYPLTLGVDFNAPGVNINGGDVLRLLDANGNVVDTAEVLSVDTSIRLKLRSPGLTASAVLLQSAVTFEVYLEQAPVPHEQSNDQLLDLLTDVVVRKVGVDYPGGDTAGAYVDEFNAMKDDTLTGTWSDEGVQKGDYIVVDPAGVLYIEQEVGARAVGDMSTVGRIGGNYTAGGTSELDDNRGFYLVEDVGEDSLTVSGASRFCGGADDGSDDVVSGNVGTSDYVVLPTVHDSLLTGWTGPTGTDPARGSQEGQQSLRPTAPAVDDGSGNLSYKARDAGDYSLYKSLGPFGYRIIRPSPVFSKDATELVLFQRSRFLSWMEEINTAYDKGGDYYIFQKDDHINELPSATDPTTGLGVLTNVGLESLAGVTDGAPFENASDCVSILDRRFWILDYRLDSEFNPSGTPYTAFVTNNEGQRPVLVDFIEGVLDMGDKFREQRFSWITFRADRTDGSIIVADREERQLPKNLRKERTLALQRKALDDS